ncbi:MAG: GNAT family N-acetyltransferase, partial [Bacteroidetes bacterium]|nr:GNAT family N-acetyltransferase [Bacteroidota bacterium]
PIINETIAKGGKLLVLTDDADLIIGSSWMTQDGRRMFLHHFAIDPEYQGRGLSHLLMRESMSWMEDIGLQIKLEVHRSNEIAKALYCRYGFQELGDYVVFIIREPKKKDAD